MKMYARLTDGQIGLMLTDEEYEQRGEWAKHEDFQYVEVPDDFDFADMMNYTIVDGQITYSARPLTDFEKESLKAAKREQQFQKAIQKLIRKAGFTAEEALEMGYLYPEWVDGEQHKKGEIYVYEDSLYECIKNDNGKKGINVTDTDYWERIGEIQ